MFSTSFKATLKAFLWANIHWIMVGVLAMILIFYIISSIQSCGRAADEKKQKQDRETIQQEKGKIQILEEERKNVKEEIKQAETNSNNAAANANAVHNTDSGTRDSDATNAIREFCKDHPNDSNCTNYH